MSTNSNIYSVFEKTAATYAENIAVAQSDGRQINFKALYEKAEAAAARFAAIGMKKGSRVFFMMNMSVDFYVLLLALVKTGAVVIIVDPWMKRKNIDRTIKSIEPDFFIGSLKPMLYFHLFPSFWKVPVKIEASAFLREPIVPGSADTVTVKAGKEETALITFTTGSTGTPKGIIRTHGMLYAQYGILNSVQGYGHKDRDLQPFPVFLLANLGRGAASFIPWGKKNDVEAVDMERVRNMIRDNNITVVTASPAFIFRLNANDKDAAFPEVKKVFCGGGAVTSDLVKTASLMFPNSEMFAVYGSTEAEPICEINAKQLRAALKEKNAEGTCVGYQVKGVAVKFESAEYAKVSGFQPGEICVSGDHVCKSYFNVDKNSVQYKLRDKKGIIWHNTGDIGYKDKKGRIWFCGRVNNLIRCGDKKMPAELIELKIQEKTGFRPVIMEVKGINVMAVMRRDKKMFNENRTAIEKILEKYSVEISREFFPGKIPMDPRHRTKTDYQGLRQMLEEKIHE